MRILRAGLFCLLFSASILAQTNKELFRLNGPLGLPDPEGGPVQTVPLKNGNRFLVIGKNRVQVWDIADARLVNTYIHKITGFQDVGLLRRIFSFPNQMEVNREGTLGVLLSKGPDEKSGKNKVAGVWNLQTGERLAILDRPLKPLRSAFFSENGATIMTMHGELKEAELSFWDAGTFAHRAAITLQDLSFHQLSRDGGHIYIGSARANKWLGINVIGFETSKGIELWNTRTGKLEKTYADGDIKFWNPFNSSPVVSGDEKYLAARSEGNKIVVWETAGDGRPKYTVPAGDPKKKLRLLGISGDSRYLLTARGEDAEIYELETGKLYRAFPLRYNGTYELSPDSRYAIRQSQGWAGIYDLENEKELYSLTLTVRTEQKENEANYEYQVENIKVSPDGKFIMVYGDRDARIYDLVTGEQIQTLVDPQRAKYKDNGRIKSNGLDNNRAGWLASGDSIYVFAGDGKSFYLWNKK